MPIRIERVEPHIYLAHYEGKLTVEEVTAGNMERMAQEHDETPYVAIIDATNLDSIPFDVKRLRKMDKDYDTNEVIIVKPPMMLAILADVMRRVMSKKMYHVNTMDEALTMARTHAARLIAETAS